MTPRPSLRLRLTAIYGALFFAAGGVLLAANYSIVHHSLPTDKIAFSSRTDGPVDSGKSAPFPGTPEGVTRSDDVPAQFIGPKDGAGTVAFGVFVNGEAASPDLIAELPGKFRNETLHSLVTRSLMGLVGVGAASVLLGWWLAGRALRPLHRITDTARRLSETNLDERIGLDGPHDELRELADTFDAMLGRLDAAFDSQRRFVANASHELRTPLAIMRTQLEVARSPEELQAASEVVQHVIERSERLLDGLLVLARADGQLATQPTDLADALLSASVSPSADEVEVTITADPAPVDGDPALLLHLARNLLENACRHNVDDGWVRARSGTDGDEAVLEVTNSGPVVPADAVERLFEPFRRLAADRTEGDTGAGLGLSIVRAVARAHGGEVTAEPLPEGGLRVEVRLPAARTRIPRPSRSNFTSPAAA
ncbi:MAG: cutS [Acidimicrobiales bacterium]|nr:cutS [Acidimicrobiales bacterium]